MTKEDKKKLKQKYKASLEENEMCPNGCGEMTYYSGHITIESSYLEVWVYVCDKCGHISECNVDW